MRLTKRTVEQVYDEMPYNYKEDAGLPMRFYMLKTEQVYFLQNLVDSLDKPDQDELLSARDLMNEALESLNAAINKGE